MKGFGSLNGLAKTYWAGVVMLGLAAAAIGIANMQRPDYTALLVYSVAAIAVARFKIRLPGTTGTLSMNYVVVLVVLMNCDAGVGMIVALTSTVAQCLIRSARRPAWFQVVFSVAGVSLPVLAAEELLRSSYLAHTRPTGCVPVLAASTAYYLVNTITVAGIVSVTSREKLIKIWRTSFLWTYAQYLVGGAIALGVHLLTRNFGMGALVIAAPPLYLLYRSYTTYLGRIEEQHRHLEEMAALHMRTIETLALAIDAKDDTTAAHLRRVQIYATSIGEEMKLSRSEIQALRAAALLHDVGKLAVPEYIISKPGKLTPEEFEKMKVHPVVGAEILERVNFPYPVVPIVRSHHEKYDGSGYPDGLAGDEIPIGARILSAVDCLDALASDRQYREALPLDEAMAIVAKQAGSSFDPKVVEILQRQYKELEQRAKSETTQRTRLSTNIRVPRGRAPATGFADEKRFKVEDAGRNGDFSQSIASARQEIHLLTEVINDLGNSLSLDDTLALLAVRLDKAVAHDAIAVYLIRNGKLIPRLVKGESYRLFSSLEIPVGQGLSGWVAENNRSLVNVNPAVEFGYLDDPRKMTPLRSGIAIPLNSQDGIVGVLTLYSLRAEAFTPDHNRLLLAIAPKAANAIQNSLRFECVETAAETDELTGLANCRYLFSHLSAQVGRASREGGSFAVMLMDLDGFKQANDQFGHLTGNRILQAVARELRRNTRADDLVARIGGDEFVVVMMQPEEHESDFIDHIERIADRVQNEVQCSAPVGMSVGVARYPDDGTDAETLLERADERMYEAKRRKQSLQTLARYAAGETAQTAEAVVVMAS